jgi:hypothetical protein
MVNSKLIRIVTLIVFVYLITQMTFWSLKNGWNTNVGYGEVPISCDLDQCAKLLKNGGPDYAYYINLANYFNQNQSYIPISSWLLKAWPPGMGFYYAFISKLTFDSSYFLALHIFLMIFGWSALLTYPVMKSSSLKTSLMKGAIAALLINLSLFKEWLFSGFIIYSEALGLLLFFSFIVFFCKTQSDTLTELPKLKIVIAGVLLAMAAYVRIVFDLAALVFITIVALIYLVRLFAKKKLKINENSMRGSLYICLIFLMLTLPWRIFAFSELDSKSATFASNSNGAWVNAWTPTENWDVDGNSYFVSVGINHLCVSYPVACLELNSSGSIESNEFRKKGVTSIVSNPRPWLENRSRVFLSSFKNSSQSNLFLHGWVFSTLVGLYTMINFFKTVIRRKFRYHDERLLLTATSFILTGITIMPLILTAFEPRYLYTLAILPWFILLYSSEFTFPLRKIYNRVRAGLPATT